MAYRSLSLAVLTLVAITLLTVGCTGSRRGGSLPRDGGTSPGDSSVDDDASNPPDSGIVLMDSGTTVPECDTARPCPVGQTCVSGTCQAETPPPECSASRPCPTGQICNASGMCITDTGRVCPDGNVEYVTGSYCSSETASCVSGCTTGTCQQDCLDADVSADCGGCVNQNSISCANSASCQSEWDAYNCCILDTCGSEPSSTCISSAIDGSCAGAVGSWRTCSGTVDLNAVCSTWVSDCF